MSKKQLSTVKNNNKDNTLSVLAKGHATDELLSMPGRSEQNSWSVPWADLMMVMFVLFTVLFVYAMNNPEIKNIFEQVTYGGSKRLSYQTQSGSMSAGHFLDTGENNQKMNVLFQQLNSKIKNYSAQDVSLHLEKDQAIIIRLHGSRIFNADKASLNPGAVSILLGIAEILEMKRDLIQVIGHIEKAEQDKAPANWELSSKRAGNVAKFLIQEAGLEAQRFTIIAQAAHNPLVPDLSKQKGNLNRRVDIRVLSGRQIQTQG